MKRGILLLLMIGWGGILASQAQERPEIPWNDSLSAEEQYPITRSIVLKTNPGAIILGQIPFTAEYRLTMETVTAPLQSYQISFSYLGKSPVFSALEDSASNTTQPIKLTVNGFRAQFSYRFYINGLMEDIGLSRFKLAPAGFFISPHVSYASAKVSNKYVSNFDIYTNVSHFNINLLGGYQYVYEFLTIEMFMGLGWKHNSWAESDLGGKRVLSREELEDRTYPHYVDPFKFSSGMRFGVAF